MDRNIALDILRTLATMLVILLHVSAEYIENYIELNSFDENFIFVNFLDSFSRISVPLFVIISGRFLLGRKESLKEFYKKRMMRIFIPLLAWTIIYSLYTLFGRYYLDGYFSFNIIVEGIVYGKPFYHLWYLYMLIGLYMVTPAINYFIAELNIKTLWAISGAFMLIGMGLMAFDTYEQNRPFFLLWFIYYLGYYLYGYLFLKAKSSSIIMLVAIYVGASIGIALLTNYTIVAHGSLYFYNFLSPLVVIGSLSIYKLFLQLELKSNFLAKIANLSFGIYLIHALILNLLSFAINKMGLSIFENPFVGVPVKFLIVLSLSIVSIFYINKIKYLKRIV